jgi:hypothetical protein
MIFAPRSLYEEYQRQIFRVLSCEPRLPDFSTPVQNQCEDQKSMFNISRVSLKQEILEESLVSSRRKEEEESKE